MNDCNNLRKMDCRLESYSVINRLQVTELLVTKKFRKLRVTGFDGMF